MIPKSSTKGTGILYVRERERERERERYRLVHCCLCGGQKCPLFVNRVMLSFFFSIEFVTFASIRLG